MSGKTKRYLTIKNELFLLGTLFLLIVTILFAGMFIDILYDNSMDSARNSLQQFNSQIVTYTEGMFHENATIVEILSRDKAVVNAGNGNTSEVLEILENIHSRNANITYIYAGYADGSLIISRYPIPRDYDSTTRPWYQAALESNDVARLVYEDAATGEWLFSQSVKLVNDDGDVVGAVCIDCSNESISNELGSHYQYKSQRSYIMSSDGTILIHPNEKEINLSIRKDLDDETWADIVSGRRNYAEYYKNGALVMAYYEKIAETDFIVASAIEVKEVREPILHKMLFLVLLIVGITCLSGLILSRIVIRRFARPVMELGERIRNLASGNPGEQRNLSFSNHEINAIAESIEILVKDMANQEEQRKAAEFLSHHDSMTGLYNRRFYEEELRRMEGKQKYPFAVICCDVNGLKLVNDIFGHAVGDKLLTVIAGCLEKGCGSRDIIARVGGDEFAVILPESSEEEARQTISRIKAHFPIHSISGAEVSASLGYGVKRSKLQLMADVLRAADEMMYEQKIKESEEMKNRTIANIIEVAEREGFIRPVSAKEEEVLDYYAAALCPESRGLLKDSYHLRRIGLCSLVALPESGSVDQNKHYSETGYRILSSMDSYRSIAGCVLHHTEQWDGKGWPAGLAGRDIPLLSRIIAVTDQYMKCSEIEDMLMKSGSVYDPELIGMLVEMKKKRN